VHKNGLSDFWRSIIKHYRVKLDNNKIRYIIMQKKGKSSRDIDDSFFACIMQKGSANIQRIHEY
jgi:hypothetical protein